MKIDSNDLIQILPYSISTDENVRNIAKALNGNLNDTTALIRNVLIYSRIDELDDALLDSLAWQFHIDAYDATYTLSQKRQLVKDAIKDHFYKGTPYALEAALSIISDAEMEEWFDYGASPYHFRVHLKRMPKNANEYGKVDSICKSTKNVRSWCDGVQCDVGVNWSIYVGGAKQIKKSITIYQKGGDEQSNAVEWYAGVAAKYREEENLYSERRQVVTATSCAGGVVRIRKTQEVRST